MGKKYSLDEIDFMRWAVAADYVLANYPACKGMHYDQLGQPYGVNKHACGSCLAEIIDRRIEEKASEEKLRTAMMNGTAPQELAARVHARYVASPGFGVMFWPPEFSDRMPPLKAD